MINTIYENHLVLLLPVVGPSYVLRVLDFAILWFSDTKGYFCHLTAFNFREHDYIAFDEYQLGGASVIAKFHS